jgi:hypothetical protein
MTARHEAGGADDLRLMLDRVATVPTTLRRFSVTRGRAATTAGIPAGLLADLMAGGLPWVGDSADPLFDAADLTTISLALRLDSGRRAAMRYWPRTLRRVRQGRVMYAVRFVATCPAPGHTGPCEWRLRISPDAPSELLTPPTQVDEVIEITSAGAAPPAPPHIERILRTYDDVSFYLLPPSARWRPDFVRRHRIAECGALARLIVDDAHTAGIAARLSFGLIVSPPYSSTHCWPEFEVDGRWVPYDPLLLRSLRVWAVPGAEDLDPMSSPAGLYHRLADDFLPLAMHFGRPCPVSLPTRVVA